MSGLRKRTLTVVVIAIGVLGMSTAVVYAGTHGGHGPTPRARSTAPITATAGTATRASRPP